jgi:hypothetical protein
VSAVVSGDAYQRNKPGSFVLWTYSSCVQSVSAVWLSSRVQVPFFLACVYPGPVCTASHDVMLASERAWPLCAIGCVLGGAVRDCRNAAFPGQKGLKCTFKVEAAAMQHRIVSKWLPNHLAGDSSAPRGVVCTSWLFSQLSILSICWVHVLGVHWPAASIHTIITSQ